jgi:hypothetical protein
VGVYDSALAKLPVVGHDASKDGDDAWPPPFSVQDPISGEVNVYEKGEVRAPTGEEVASLEPAAVWDRGQIIERIADATGGS